MPFIRLTDNYNDDPKIDVLGDGAYRLWHHLLAYCRRQQTDGLIPKSIMLGCKHYRPKRLDELMAILPFETEPLVSRVESFGFKMHNYLKWNPSKDEENERRAGTRDRMRKFRERDGVTSAVTSVVTARNVLDREREVFNALPEKGSGEKPDLGDRARELLEAYPRWFAEERHGARIALLGGPIQFAEAMKLCEIWDDARLEKLARLVLDTDDPWIAGTDRGWKIFVMKSSWADDRLRQWEQANGVAV